MTRHGHLFDRLASFENLLAAAQAARRGKRFKPNTAQFDYHLERELLTLQRELQEGRYRPGPYRTFTIREPKTRLISAAPYRDRVVHHALCRVIEPIFERAFVKDSYACRVGKGTHAAVAVFQRHARRYAYVLKCDIAKYFPSIDHDLLFDLLTRKIKDRRVLDLIRTIIDASNEQDFVCRHFEGDDLFSPLERRRGIPIGNLTSQFFANVYLDGLDHHVKETLRMPGYVRYVDDFLLFADDKGRLHEARAVIEERCAALRVRLHPRKCVLAPVTAGFTFLGYRIFPAFRRLEADNVRRFKRRLRRYRDAVAARTLSLAKVTECVRSWVAHAEHADTMMIRKRVLWDVAWSLSPGRNGVGPLVSCAAGPGTINRRTCDQRTGTGINP